MPEAPAATPDVPKPELGTQPPPVAPPAADPPKPEATPPANDDEFQPPTKEQVEAMQAAIAAANQRAKKLENEQAAAAKKAAAEAGNFEELHKAEQERATKLETGIKTLAINGAITAAAQRLGFINPTLATTLIAKDGINAELGDDFTAQLDQAANVEIERRLTEVLTRDPYLKGDPPRAQLAGAGDSEGGPTGGHAAMNAQIRKAAGRA